MVSDNIYYCKRATEGKAISSSFKTKFIVYWLISQSQSEVVSDDIYYCKRATEGKAISSSLKDKVYCILAHQLVTIRSGL